MNSRAKFTGEYEQLNPRQRDAVDSADRRVLVTGGPGTGKTKVLLMRITRLVLEMEIQPSQILCITATSPAVECIREQLSAIVGEPVADIHFVTGENFAATIIRENGLLQKGAMRPVSSFQKVQEWKKLVDAFPTGHPLKKYRGDVYAVIPHLQHLSTTIGEHGYTPTSLLKEMALQPDTLSPQDGKFPAETTPNAEVQMRNSPGGLKETMNYLQAGITELEQYQNFLARNRCGGEEEQTQWLYDYLQRNNELLTLLHTQYTYILVDEFQELSASQTALIHLLAGENKHSALFVAGDDEQRLRKLPGALPENMAALFRGHPADLKTFRLEKNYRRNNWVIERFNTSLKTNHPSPQKQNAFDGDPAIPVLQTLPRGTVYESVTAEISDISRKVKQLSENGVPAETIGVVYNGDNYGSLLLRHFKSQHITVRNNCSIDLLRHPFAKKLLSILAYLDAAHQTPYSGDPYLFDLLHFECFEIPALEIAKLTLATNSRRPKNGRSTLREVLNEEATRPPRDLFDPGIHPRLKWLNNILGNLIRQIPGRDPAGLFEQVLKDAEILSFVNQNEDDERLKICLAILDLVKAETAFNPGLELNEFVDILELMVKERIPLDIQIPGAGNRGVYLLPAGETKGLEFAHLFLTGTHAGNWEDQKKQDDHFGFQTTFFAAGTQLDKAALERLFYVAVTRSKSNLHISYASHVNGIQSQPSVFLEPLVPEEWLRPSLLLALENSIVAGSNASPSTTHIVPLPEEITRVLIGRFVMNVSALNNYLDCPLGFYYKNILRIPTPKNEATAFGSAVHHALELLFRKMQEGKRAVFPPVEQLLEDFYSFMEGNRALFNQEAFSRRIRYGEAVLRNYYANYAGTFHAVVSVELNIRAEINGVPVKGKIDKLEFDGKQVRVVDYKTGDIDKAKARMHPPRESDPNGGDYWRQAVFYKILVDNYSKKDWRVVSAEFDFIEPDKAHQYRKINVPITPADVETVTQQLTMVWHKIQARDFYTGCGSDKCTWCNFAKDNKLTLP